MTPKNIGFFLACLLLYAGPFLAGLINLPWSVLPVLALIFLMWLVVMRPVQFAAKNHAGLAVVIAVTAGVQLILVALVWGLGRLFASYVALDDLSTAWPLALSALAIPASRAVRAPVTAEMNEFLDDATQTLERMAEDISADVRDRPRPEDDKAASDAVASTFDALAELDFETVTLSDIDDITDRMADPGDAVAFMHAVRAMENPAPLLLVADVTVTLRPDVIDAENYSDQSIPLIRALDSGAPRVIAMASEATRWMFHHVGQRAVHVDLPSQGDLLSRAAAFADAGNEASAHDIRGIVKAMQNAQDDYDAATRGQDDD